MSLKYCHGLHIQQAEKNYDNSRQGFELFCDIYQKYNNMLSTMT